MRVVIEDGPCPHCPCGEHHAKDPARWPSSCEACGRKFSDAAVRSVR